MKEQLLPSEKSCGLAPPHYPTLLTVPTSVALPTNISMDSDTKPEHLTPTSQTSVTQNITVVPVQSAGLMTTGEVIWMVQLLTQRFRLFLIKEYS